MSAIVGLGEVLWDLLPSGKVLGGAPCNFVFHCHQLGQPAIMVSRVGDDLLGREIRTSMRSLGLEDDYLQVDPIHPTGTVSVSLSSGQPSYTIHENVAWDYLTIEDRLVQLVRQAKAVCFGTLIQRGQDSRETVRQLLGEAKNALIVFDINLRQQYYTREIIEASLHASHWVKLNDDELHLLRDMLTLSGSDDRSLLADIRTRYAVDLVALTLGARGCLIQTATEEVETPGEIVNVVDTIGAGDSFTAGLVVRRLEKASLPDAARFANRLAGLVAGSRGGTPRIDRSMVER